jgi:hypothetical protein
VVRGQALVSSTSDAAGRDAGSMLAFRSVQQGNHCVREEFLYELKAGPAGGRRRRPPSDGTLTSNGTPDYDQRSSFGIQSELLGSTSPQVGLSNIASCLRDIKRELDAIRTGINA